METNRIICPFCGIDITETHHRRHSLLQEETTERDFSFESNWAGSYMKETKYTKKFIVYCCENCYAGHENYEKLSDTYSSFAIPIGFLVGFSYFIYRIIIEDLSFAFGTIIGPILYGIIGIALFAIPNIFIYLLFEKRTSYKHAKKCNAIRY